MINRLLIAVLAAMIGSTASAATWDVSNPTEFQQRLTEAQNNNESDTINVLAGTYDISALGTLTYVAAATENFGLTINGTDSDTRILDGGMQVPILRIDSSAVSNDGGVYFEVLNLTFRNGIAVGTPDDGGALSIVTDDLLQPPEHATLIQVTGSEFFDNAADDDGGAIYIRGHAVEGIYLDDLTIDGNQAGGDGGGACVLGGQFTTPIFFSDIDFFDNVAVGNGGGLLAGGFDPDTPSEDRNTSISLFDILFYNNSAPSMSSFGGGADVASLDISVDTVGFVDNNANIGGGLRVRPAFGDLTIVNSGFVGNTADDQGGGLDVGPVIIADVTLTNNTFSANAAPNRGGGASIGIDNGTSRARFYNNIIWGNIGSFDSDDLYVDNNALNDIPAEVEIFNNDITEFLVTPGPVSSGSNIDIDPMLANISARPEPDPRLLVGSPAIDAGDDAAPSRPPDDFEFDARPFDGDGDTVATTDIGMDEFTGALPEADVAVDKTDDPDPVTGGNNLTYTVVVTNNGPVDATNVTLTDTLDAALSFVSATATQGTCVEASGVVTCSLGTIADGATATATIIVATPEVVDPTQVFNTANVIATETDPNGVNNDVTETSTILPPGPAMADLALTKVDSPDPVFSGGPDLTYTLTITNNGTDPATGVSLTDTLPGPTEITFVSATPSVGSCTESSGIVSCSIGDLAVDASATVTIVVNPIVVVDPTDITNLANVTGNEMDPVVENNSASETTTVNPPESDMMVAVVSTPAEPSIGEQFSYDISVTNDGPSDNTTVVITITLPASGTVDDISVSQGSCGPPTDGIVICTIGDMAALATVTAQVLMTAPDVAAELLLGVDVSGAIADPTAANNSANSSTSVIEAIIIVIRGESDGAGSFGWIGLLILLAAAASRFARSKRAPGVSALLPWLVVFALALVPASNVYAEGQWYVHAAIGDVDLDYDESDLTSDLLSRGWAITSPNVDSSGTAWKVFGGFMFNDYFGLEGGYVDLGDVTTLFTASIPPSDVDPLLRDTFAVHPIQGDGWVAAGVVRWPFADDKFALAARAGMFFWEADVDVRVIQGATGSVSGDDDGTDAMWGVGIEWKLNETWSLTADYERYQFDDWLDAPSIGVRVTF